ncbi:hypothetical protein [Actinoallomurus acaciae]|uniref:Uncharacterized protein n=1 Tax=Actinoallomurus acaciae TaxID=502577 RepID=A0ABV5YVI0_9ACTN
MADGIAVGILPARPAGMVIRPGLRRAMHADIRVGLRPVIGPGIRAAIRAGIRPIMPVGVRPGMCSAMRVGIRAAMAAWAADMRPREGAFMPRARRPSS